MRRPAPARARHARIAALALGTALGAAGCAHAPAARDAAGQAAAAERPMAPPMAAAARARMAGRATPERLSCSLRLTRFGPEGRMRTTLQVLLERPNHFRCTALAPHGPPLMVVACDGDQITALDVPARRYRRLPATAAAMAPLLPGLDLDLAPDEWLALLLGAFVPPPEAQASVGADHLEHWRWQRAGQAVHATTDAQGALVGLELRLGDGRVASVRVRGRDALGLPQQLLVHLEGGRERGSVYTGDVELVLGDVAVLAAPAPAGAFVVDAPAAPAL